MAPLIKFDPARLQAQLLNTGLQQKDNPLYQFLFLLVGAVNQINNLASPASGSGGGGGSSSIINILQMMSGGDGDSSGSSGGDISIPGPAGTNGTNGINGVPGMPGEDAIDDYPLIPGPQGNDGPMVPYFIGINETFLVPLYKQALFSMNIDNEGTLELDGFLIEVD